MLIFTISALIRRSVATSVMAGKYICADIGENDADHDAIKTRKSFCLLLKIEYAGVVWFDVMDLCLNSADGDAITEPGAIGNASFVEHAIPTPVADIGTSTLSWIYDMLTHNKSKHLSASYI